MTRIFLAINAVLFLGFGVFSMVRPEQLADLLDAAQIGIDGLYELRSNYGGVSLGIGLLCLSGVLRPVLRRPALFVLLTYTGGYALGRIIALPLANGLPSMSLLAFGVFEAVTALLALWLLRRATDERRG